MSNIKPYLPSGSYEWALACLGALALIGILGLTTVTAAELGSGFQGTVVVAFALCVAFLALLYAIDRMRGIDRLDLPPVASYYPAKDDR